MVSDFKALVTKYLKTLITEIQSLKSGKSCPLSRPAGLCRNPEKIYPAWDIQEKIIPLHTRHHTKKPWKRFYRMCHMMAQNEKGYMVKFLLHVRRHTCRTFTCVFVISKWCRQSLLWLYSVLLYYILFISGKYVSFLCVYELRFSYKWVLSSMCLVSPTPDTRSQLIEHGAENGILRICKIQDSDIDTSTRAESCKPK